MNRKVLCPTCGKSITWDKSNPYRPFCSERCKLIDLGEWASESHRLPGEEIIPNSIDDEDQGHH